MPFGLAFSITSNANRFTGGARTELYTALTFMVLFSLFTKLLKNSAEKENLKAL